MRVVGLLILTLAACGRIGFEARLAGGDDSANDAPGTDSYTAPICANGCGALQYCGTDIGTCGTPASCRPRPGSCPLADDVACGCDGTTYMNECEAERLGTSVDHLGACASAYVPDCTPPCSTGFYCYTPVGMCGQPGTCTAIPVSGPACPDVPVCGCDGLNYGNSCAAEAAGMSIAITGPCGDV